MLFINDIDPVALTLGPVNLRWYGLLFSGGFIIGYIMMQFFFKKKGYNTADLDKLLLYIFFGTVVGARLGHCLIYEPDFYLSHPLEILFVWHGGLASHGGTAGVLLAIFLYVKRHPYNFLELCDMLSVPIALVACFIRIGNYCNSEILGIPTGGDFGVVFLRLGELFPRYPAQLMESFCYLAIFVILLIWYLRARRIVNGTIMSTLLLLIFTSRFFIEPFKVEQADYSTHTALNVGQWLSIPFILGSLILLVFLIWRDKQKRRGE